MSLILDNIRADQHSNSTRLQGVALELLEEARRGSTLEEDAVLLVQQAAVVARLAQARAVVEAS